jgi:hypothetical protein
MLLYLMTETESDILSFHLKVVRWLFLVPECGDRIRYTLLRYADKDDLRFHLMTEKESNTLPFHLKMETVMYSFHVPDDGGRISYPSFLPEDGESQVLFSCT